MKRNVAIVHYNTPELTEAAILSLRKHGGEDYQVYIFDNSDERPFTRKMKGVKIFNNRKGKYIDFDKELEKYPERDDKVGCSHGCIYGSDKHMMSVQKLWDLIPDGFLLMDSDILIRQDVDWMFQYDECVVGHILTYQVLQKDRLAPQLLWINVPMCKAGGAVFFDPDRAWALHKGTDNRNYWDTGGALLDDIRRLKPQCHGKKIDIRPLMIHYKAGSWHRNDKEAQLKWLQDNKALWWTDPSVKSRPKYTVLTYIFNGYENVHEVKEKDPTAEYILVTDDPNLKSETWEIVYDGSLLGLSAFDKCYQVRFHPFRYAHTDTVVRIDGSIEVLKPLRDMVNVFWRGEYDRCLMIHPRRNTLPEEYDVWVKTRQYPLAQAASCLMVMEKLGYNLETKGMYQGCFEIVKKNHVNTLINDMTFDLLRYMGEEGKIERLDQTVWSMVMNHLFKDRLKVMPVSENLITDSDLMAWHLHKSRRRIAVSPYTIEPVLFGEACETWEAR